VVNPREGKLSEHTITFHGVEFVRLLLPHKVYPSYVPFAKHFYLNETRRTDFDLGNFKRRGEEERKRRQNFSKKEKKKERKPP
jgi:hypothetical protein